MGTRNEVHINSALQILQARKEALDQMNKVPMRTLGKALGKDLFTWFGNNPEDMNLTLSSFPSPIHWIAKQKEVRMILDNNQDVLEKLGSLIIYDSAKFSLPQEWAQKIPTYIAVATLEDALIVSQALPRTKSIMLITGDSEDEVNFKSDIEIFAEINRKA